MVMSVFSLICVYLPSVYSLVQIFCPFFNWVVCFYIIEFESFFVYSACKSFVRCILQIFSSTLGHLFIFLISFITQKILILTKYSVPVFFFYESRFRCHSKEVFHWAFWICKFMSFIHQISEVVAITFSNIFFCTNFPFPFETLTA